MALCFYHSLTHTLSLLLSISISFSLILSFYLSYTVHKHAYSLISSKMMTYALYSQQETEWYVIP